MTDDREKTIAFGAFGGREEYESNQRRKVVSLLDHFRTQGELGLGEHLRWHRKHAVKRTLTGQHYVVQSLT